VTSVFDLEFVIPKIGQLKMMGSLCVIIEENNNQKFETPFYKPTSVSTWPMF